MRYCCDIGSNQERAGNGMEFKYVRIQGRELPYVTKYPKGIFAMC